MGLNGQASFGLGVSDIMQDIVEGTQGTSSPSFADLVEQTVLNGIPFGSAGGIMTDSDGQSKAVRHFLLEVALPNSRTVAVAAPTVCFSPLG